MMGRKRKQALLAVVPKSETDSDTPTLLQLQQAGGIILLARLVVSTKSYQEQTRLQVKAVPDAA